MRTGLPSKHVLTVELLSTMLAFYTVVYVSSQHVDVSRWGLVTALPISFWAGLVLLSSLIYLGRRSKNHMAVAFVLTFVYLYVIPTLIQEYGRNPVSYYPASESILIASEGRIPQYAGLPLLSYHDWPGYLYLVTIMTVVPGIPLIELIKYMPLLVVLMYGLIAFSALRTQLTVEGSLQGAIWLLAGYAIYTGYFQPQGVAILFYLLIFTLMTWVYLKERCRTFVMVILVLFTATLFTHLLTSLFICFGIVFLYLLRTKMRWLTVTSVFCLLLLVVTIGYFLNTASSDYIIWKTIGELREITRHLQLQSGRVTTVGSMYQVLTNWARIAIGVTSAIIILLASLRILRNINSRRREIFWLAWVCGLIPVGLISPYAAAGGGEMVMRVFMFALIPTIFLGMNLLKNKPKILWVVLVVLIFLHVPAHYGGESYLAVTSGELSGASFYSENVPSDAPYFSVYHHRLIWYFNPQGVASPNRPPIWAGMYVEAAIEPSKYLAIANQDRNMLEYYWGFDPLRNADLAAGYNLIFDNSGYQVYMAVK